MTLLNFRETEIIRHTACGRTAKEIAKLIGLEYRTIESHMLIIRKKLAARNAAHAVYLASVHDML